MIRTSPPDQPRYAQPRIGAPEPASGIATEQSRDSALYAPAPRTSSSSKWPAEAVPAPPSPASDRHTSAPSTPPRPMGSPPPSWTAKPSTCEWPRHASARTPVDGLARRPGEGHTRLPTSAHLAEDRQSPLRSRGRSRQVPGVSELINVGPDRTDRHPTSPTNLDAGKQAGAHQVIDPRPAHPQRLRDLVGTQQQSLHDHLSSVRLGFRHPRSLNVWSSVRQGDE
jgi:hypothetical protein